MGKKTCGDEDLPLLPEDYLIQILVWLPVKSLLRFKSVCKSWHALIRSSFFIDLHTAITFNSTSPSSSKFGSFILHALVVQSGFKSLPGLIRLKENAFLMLSSGSESESESVSRSGSESVSRSGSESESVSVSVSRSGGYGDWCWSTWRDGKEDKSDDDDDDDDQVFKVDNLGSNDDDQLVFKLDNLWIPSCYKFFTPPPKAIGIVGSCKGLVCLYNPGLYNTEEQMDVSLWNPATRQFRILPKCITIENGTTCRYLVAFGFDVETKDYKVVLVTCFKPRWMEPRPWECLCRVQVYSLSTDSWRLLEGIDSLPGFPFCGTCVGLYLNGSCFFMAGFFYSEQKMCFSKNDRFIISFDLTKEIFTTIQLPDHDEKQKLYLSSYLGEKMALFTASHQCPYNFDDYYDSDNEIYDYVDYDIWVLNEHGGSATKESWTKLHSFQIKGRFPGEWNMPRGISSNGEFALLETKDNNFLRKKMKLYNLVTKEVKKNFLPCNVVMSNANVYKPSIVSIIGGATAADRVIDGDSFFGNRGAM